MRSKCINSTSVVNLRVIFVNKNENENAKTAKLVTQRCLRVLRPYGVEFVTNGGRYLGRSSTHLPQQVWYSLVVGKTKTKTKTKKINRNENHAGKSITRNGFNSIDFLYDSEILAVRRSFPSILTIFTAHALFRPHYCFRFKIWRHSAHPFSYKDAVTSARDAIFGDFCNDNVCACAVSTLVLLSVANLSPEIDSATRSSYKMRTFRL